MLLLTATDHCCILKVTAVMNSKFVTAALSQICLIAYAVQLIIPDRANTHSKLKIDENASIGKKSQNACSPAIL